ncbi:MAG TPA: hydroxyacylglutathione hydrolase [Methylophilaceae bacterium]|nr:hydroxyacylglutathione hydrolase [Methylophilaceae bacterium]
MLNQVSNPKNSLEIIPIPAFQDNYIWLLRRGSHAVVVDPGDAAPVISTLKQLSLTLDAILITHHHSDHIDGVNELLQHAPALVYAPKKEHYDFKHQAVEENDVINLDTLDLQLKVMEVPGHTLGHVAYYGANYLFCGDTMFGAGCGRLFEGTPEQMYGSLQRLAKLPPETAVYCTHEYTEHNLQFAWKLEANNQALAQRIQQAAATRQADKPTLPSSIALELATNPFLRCQMRDIQISSGTENSDPIEVFTAIREMRNHF